jgi:hypothetical protein
MRHAFLALGAAAVLSAASCSSGSPRASIPATTVAPLTTTTTAPDPDVIPPVITPAYVNAVFVVLNHLASNASRLLATDRAVTPEVKSDLRAAFNDPVYAQQVQMAQQALLQGVVNNVKLSGGDPVTVVLRLMTATPGCIFAETRTNFSPIEIHATPTPASEYYELRPKQRGADPMHLNPTPWAISREEAFLTPTSVVSTCAAS